MHICIAGGGAALAQPLIEHLISEKHQIVAICRKAVPKAWRSLEIIGDVDLSVLGIPIPGVYDALVTLVGTVENGLLKNLPQVSWEKSLHDNLTAVYNSLKHIKVKDGGNIVVVGSIVGSQGGYGCASYAAAKAGLVGLVRAYANEVAEAGTCVNLLELGYVNGGMGEKLSGKVRDAVLRTIPLKRFAEPEEFVKAVDFLLHTKYMTGNTLTFAGGLR